MKYKVTIVMPVYGVEKYIEESLKSIIEQNQEKVQLILVDDGTKDNSIDIAKECLKNTKKIDYKIVAQENAGLPAARNKGFAYAEGEYICYIDSDDCISPNHLVNLVRALDATKLNVAFSDFELTYIKTGRLGSGDKCGDYEILERDDLLFKYMKRELKIHACALLIRHDFLIKNNLAFNPQLKYAEDYEFMWRLFPMTEKVVHVKDATYKYLQRENSIMRAQSIDKVVIASQVFDDSFSKMLYEHPELKNIVSLTPDRVCFAYAHAFAQQSDFASYSMLLDRLQYKRRFKNLIVFPDIKVKVLAIATLINKRLSFCMIKLY